jgi:hypothetical protein
MTDSERIMREFLLEQDRLSLPYRLERLDFLVRHFGPERHLLLIDMSAHYFEEARLCYLNGIFVACVLMVQCALEELLRGFFRLKGDDALAATAGFNTLIEHSLCEGFICQDEAQEMDDIRTARNPYVHPKGIAHPTSLFRRIETANFEKDESELMREDAQKALLCLFSLLQRPPFTPV